MTILWKLKKTQNRNLATNHNFHGCIQLCLQINYRYFINQCDRVWNEKGNKNVFVAWQHCG